MLTIKVDQVLDHALYIAGTSVTFDDWKSMSIVDKKKCLLSSKANMDIDVGAGMDES